jgi:hypothetical protein
MSYRTYRASEIGEYLYCHRAWWLKQSGGYQGYNVDEMKAGSAYHDEHHRAVTRTTLVARLALTFIFVAAGIVAFWLVRAL